MNLLTILKCAQYQHLSRLLFWNPWQELFPSLDQGINRSISYIKIKESQHGAFVLRLRTSSADRPERAM